MSKSVLSPSLRKAGRGGGSQFCLMVAGESGLGKSTLLGSLFLTDNLCPQSPLQQTLELSTKTLETEEMGVHREITLVDTPGFGVAIEDTDCAEAIVEFLDQQFER